MARQYTKTILTSLFAVLKHLDLLVSRRVLKSGVFSSVLLPECKWLLSKSLKNQVFSGLHTSQLPCETKVANLGSAVHGYKHVGRLDISVNYPSRMNEMQATKQVVHDCLYMFFGKEIRAFENFTQVLLHVFEN